MQFDLDQAERQCAHATALMASPPPLRADLIGMLLT